MAANILIGIPAFGNMVSVATLNTTHALIQMFASKGIRGGIAAFGYPDIAESRNIMLTGWYDGCPDATHLLFIDNDMGFPPNLIADMLVFDEPIIGTMCPKKTIPIQWAGSGLPEAEVKRRGDFITVGGIGMAICLIRRDAIDIMLKKMPELSDTRMEFHAAKEMLGQRIIRAFDQFDNPDNAIAGKMSEDLSFCQRWRDCGGDVWASVAYEIEHVGQYSYKGCYARYVVEREAAKEAEALKQAAE